MVLSPDIALPTSEVALKSNESHAIGSFHSALPVLASEKQSYDNNPSAELMIFALLDKPNTFNPVSLK